MGIDYYQPSVLVDRINELIDEVAELKSKVDAQQLIINNLPKGLSK